MILEPLRRAVAARVRADFDFGSIPAEARPAGGFRPAAVLVPVLEVAGAPSVLLTRRTDRLRHHPGQWSFPGGKVEAGEEPLATALREAAEEIGLAPGAAEILGRLDETLVLTSPFRLTPWVARVPYPYPFAADPGEVEEIGIVPLSSLRERGAHRTEVRLAYGLEHVVDFYDAAGIQVWGATARILTQLLGAWRTA